VESPPTLATGARAGERGKLKATKTLKKRDAYPKSGARIVKKRGAYPKPALSLPKGRLHALLLE
jgi:hypothetical protein